MNRIKSAIDTLLAAVGLDGACGAKCRFEQLGNVIKKLPETAETLFKVATNLGDYVGPNATQPVESEVLRRLLGSLHSISTQAQTDMQRMYTLVHETVFVTLPQLAQNTTRDLKLMVEAVRSLPTCPVAATFALITIKENVEAAVALVLVLKAQFEDAFYITSGDWPPWIVPTPTLITIFKELGLYLGYHSQVRSDARMPISLVAQLFFFFFFVCFFVCLFVCCCCC
jgi:regulator of replication initiation timing